MYPCKVYSIPDSCITICLHVFKIPRWPIPMANMPQAVIIKSLPPVKTDFDINPPKCVYDYNFIVSLIAQIVELKYHLANTVSDIFL